MAGILARGVEQRIGTDKVPRKRTEGALPLNAVLDGHLAVGKFAGPVDVPAVATPPCPQRISQ
jgi:hypothetical protein